MGFTARPARREDAAAVTEIYNQGIEDRIATFETRPRAVSDILPWFDRAYAFVVVADEAGEVVGYAVAQPAVIAEMMKVKDSYNCDAISAIAACAAIEDGEYAARSWNHVKGERARLTEELRQLGWSVLPSQANFILASCPGGRGKETYLGLKQQGILVRFFDKPGLTDKIRITIGTSQENNALLGGLKELSASGKAE